MSVAANGVGLGYASTLLQIHLGVGLALVGVGSALNQIPGLRKQLEGISWEAVLKTVAAAAGAAPLLATFALTQAVGAPSDVLTWAGLLVSTTALMLGALHVFLCPCFGLGIPEVNARTGDISAASLVDGARLGGRFAALARMISSLRAFGEALLVLGALPAGAQLLCASVLMRAALALHSISGLSNALALGVPAAARVDAERVVSAAPLIGSLALMDCVAWGSWSVLLAPAHPILYCAFANLLQVGLALAARTSPNGAVEEPERAEFDLQGSLSSAVDPLRRITVMGLYTAMGTSVVRIIMGTFGVAVSASGFSIQWGDPLFAGAAKMATLLLVVYGAEFALSAGKPKTPVLATNGCDGGHEGAEHHVAERAPGAMHYLKATVVPVQSLVLAMIAAYLSAQQAPKDRTLGVAFAAATAPFKFGFLMAAMGVGLQVVMLLLFLAGQGSAPAPPPLDHTGTLQWQPEGEVALKVMAGARQATILLLEGGLLLGWIGLGLPLWLALSLALGPVIYLLLPAEARQVARGVAAASLGSVKVVADCLASHADKYLKQREHARAAMQAQRADEMAAEVDREMGAGGVDGLKSAKPLKGAKAQAAPAPAQPKAAKPKSAPKSSGKKRK